MTTHCSWCDQETGRTPAPGESHGICAAHRDRLLTEYRGEVSASEVAGTYRELERAAELDEQRTDRIMCAAYGRTPWTMARDVALGFMAGVLILGTAILAMLAL